MSLSNELHPISTKVTIFWQNQVENRCGALPSIEWARWKNKCGPERQF